MAWETEKLDRTLMIEKSTVGGKTAYAIHPFCRVHKVSGETFLEALPHNELLGARDVLVFNAIEFIEPSNLGGGRKPLAGDLDLTNAGTNSAVRKGA